MTWTQLLAIGFCGVLGYWLVAVFFPLLVKAKEDYRDPSTVEPEPSEEPPPHSESADKRMWFQVLGVHEDASQSEITAAYRQKVRAYHPDRVMQMAPEIRELAERRSKEINSAYDAGIRLRNR